MAVSKNLTATARTVFQVRKTNPEKNCFLQFDKLYVGKG